MMDRERETENSQASPAEEEARRRDDEAKGEGSRTPEDLTAAYQKALTEKQEFYDLLLRKQAELENFRKRMQREKEEFLQHSNADLVRSLLPTLDAFERALRQRDPKVPTQFYQGLELIYRELMEALGRTGLKTVEAKGQIFDPAVHQAVETLEATGVRDQEVVEELQRGYKLKHRLLRPAIVKVAVQPPNGTPQPSESRTAKK